MFPEVDLKTFVNISDDLASNAKILIDKGEFTAEQLAEIKKTAKFVREDIAKSGKTIEKVVQEAGALIYKSDFATHMTNVAGFTQQRGIIGGHNLANFENYLTTNRIEINRLPTPNNSTIDGLTELTYQIKKADGSGGWKSGSFKKSLYDPAKLTDAEMVQFGKEAMDEGILSNRIRLQTNSNTVINGVSKNGMKFTGYKDPNTGEILNFHPVLNW
ncbi:MAG: CdiA family toxin C-terminal domain-containing protein [Bacteroidota bacterium]|nr:CdiA family toxin C-terminal domain-containing protein [Bacteroidota bacterium]